MKKNIIIAILVLVVLILAGVSFYLSERVRIADNYIKVLESDFPEYLDTTSGTDEFWEYYK